MTTRFVWPRGIRQLFTCLFLMTSLPPVFAQEIRTAEELKKMDLDELLDTKVISASRTLEEWTTAPTAIDVLTDEGIRRSGAVRLPDLFRHITGVHVARGAGNAYSITARGFASAAANKMQVLMDGRSLYTPLFSGVFWEVQDTLLEDLDRIEVVRGPGATLWGANAVNGVINIISKNAKDTQGLLVMGGGGNEERAFAGIRYGDKIGPYTYYRTYLKYQNRDEQLLANREGAEDEMQDGRWGFRTDSFLPGQNLLTVQGDAYYNDAGLSGRDDAENYGGNLLARWTHDFSADSDLQVQTYYDRAVRDIPLQFREDRNTWDLDLQHHFRLNERFDFVWGGNYRYSHDETEDEPDRTFQFDPADRGIDLVSGFAQGEIGLVPDRLKFILGSKFEHNDFTGFEIQPSGRLAFTPAEQHTIWAAVSRAVRTPTRVDTDVRFMPIPGLVTIRGNEDFNSEELIAYELGYRVQPHKRVFVDLTGFYNDYNRLRTLEPSAPFGIPLVVMNEREGNTYGGEVAIKYQMTHWWRLSGSYAYLQEDLEAKEGSLDPTAGTLEANDPHHIATFHSAMDLPGNLQFDWIVRYVDRLPDPYIPSYLVFDVRIAWYPVNNLELAVVGQNLLDDRHPEFPVGALRPQIQHGVYGKVTWRH